MNVKRNAKRLLALMLAAVMLVGLLPLGVLAADEPVAVVVAASDFQQNGGHEVSDSVMEGILSAMKGAGIPSVDGAIFCGDYSNSYTAAESNKGIGYVYENYNTTWGLDYDDIIFVQGNHDPIDTANLDPTGANDPESGEYGVFVLNEDDYSWYGGSASGVQALAAELKAYLDEKIEAKFEAPIFVASHLPLHYSMRTYNDGDCRYAQYLFDVLNDAAENGLNIIYLYGHNHSQSFENYHGGGAVFYSAGDEILIGDTTNNKTHHTETIQFTYMNAGYTGRFDSEDTADPTNTGTVFEIYEDKVVIRRFDANGLHNLKSAGVQSKKYSEEASLYAPNTRVETSPQTIALAQFVPDAEVRDEATGITVTAPGLTGLTVKTNKVDIPERYSAYVSYDIEPAGYTEGTKATVVIPLDTSVFDVNRRVQILDQEHGTAAYANIVNGKVTFTTTHFSTYDVAQLDTTAADWVEIPQDAATIFRLVDSMTNDGSVYLIANSNAAGDAKILSYSGANLDDSKDNHEPIDAEIKSDDTGLYIEAPAVSAQWEYRSNKYLYNMENTDLHLRASNSGLYLTKTGVYTNGSVWNYNSNNGLSTIRDDGTVFYISYANGVFSHTKNQGENRIYVYKQEVLPAVIEYAALTGTTSYDLATGTYADQAAVIALVKQNITVLVAEDAAGSGAAETEHYEITGTVDPSAEGTYTLEVSYKGVELGTVSVRVKDKEISKLAVDPMIGSVVKKSKATVETGSIMTVTFDDGTTMEVPVTVGMLSGENLDLKTVGTCTDLTVTYGGQTVTGYTLNVLNALGNNYPEYPNEGAVKVGKTGTGIDFQSSGIAQVEISASGVPSNKGADVIIMLDTSSSMNQQLEDKSATRMEALRTSLDTLIRQLQQKRADGTDPDIRVAVTDFNGYVMGNDGDANSPYYRDTENDLIGGSFTGDADVDTYVFTNANGTLDAPVAATADTLNATAFQDINTIDLDNNNPFGNKIEMQSGTNYDYAFDAVYQLGEAVLAQNAQNGEERDLYVIFMSDGGPFQYNYFSGNSSDYSEEEGDWNDWLNGTYASWQDVPKATDSTHQYFYNGPGNSHRMADAIKGDPSAMYTVIRKNADPDTYVDVTGDGNADAYMTQVPGLGATMYSIGFCIVDDQQLESTTIEDVLKGISSDPDKYYYSVDSGESLDGAFAAIGSDISYAAYNARFVDQMGDDYNLQMAVSNYSVVDGNTTTPKSITPKIEILSYDIYTKAEADEVKEGTAGDTVTNAMIGDRKGTSTVIETVTFNTDGTEAYSTLNSTGPNGEIITAGSNILIDGVIYANTFWYNTKVTNVTITGVDIPTGTNSDGTTSGSTNVLPSETFYWKMGTVQTSELAMRYYVYLEGSIEGTREAGSYPTNEYATLYYDNYLENPCKKDTVSPVLAWKEANVSYAFYLVNENGEIIVNQTTGQTGSFANKIAVTNPVVYDTVLLNTNEEIDAVEAAKVLPAGYTLFDATYTDGDITDGATYTVTVNSNTTGSWAITSVKDVKTTYVTQYKTDDASAYSNTLNNSTVGDDYTHTIVWFAVLWKVQALPDAVVIDYGLPVDISVLTNDMFGENGKLAGVGAYSDSVNLDGYDAVLASGFGDSHTGTYGTATADKTTGKVRYTLNTSNGMQMQTYEKFAYAVNYTGTTNPGYYYDTVTVIPATTIYFEDDFLTYSVKNNNGTPADTSDDIVKATDWEFEGTLVDGATQDEDRPGQYSLTDANNIYGYDKVNLDMSTFSLGRARKVKVDADTYATAEFTFYGTGFDVISMTSNKTGTITVQVKDEAGNAVKNAAVHTYYGYNYEQTGTDENENPVYGWVSYPDVDKAMYQVPVMQIEELPYGKYTVTIKATYATTFDKTTEAGYWLYLDAIRIYDPANDGAADGITDTTIEDAYKADGEGWPSYIELRNQLIDAQTLGNAATDTKITGLVFIDGDETVDDAQISDYISYGPNNEVYLAPGQRVAFLLDTPENIAKVHIGIKSADGNAGTYTITNIARNADTDNKVKAGDYYGEKTYTVNTTTDMYYDLTGWKGDIIVISNTGDKYNTTGIISLTNIKSTYTSDPASEVQAYSLMTASEDQTDEVTAVSETSVYMTPAAATLTLRSLNSGAEEEVPEETEPEITVPEETEPETTVPEETEAETTVPEETEPETTVPEETEPETTEPEENSGSGSIWDWIGKLIGWIFG